MKPNRSRSGPGSSPARVVAPDQGEARDLDRDGRRPGTLADHDVDPEVLHRQVEHLLGGPGHPVDLVEEEHLALDQTGQDGRQVAGVLDRRTARDPQRGRHLRRDDHRQGGLAESRRPGQQDVVGHPAAVPGGLEHQSELVAHPRLALELGQAGRSQRRLGGPLLRVGPGRTRLDWLIGSDSRQLVPSSGSSAGQGLQRGPHQRRDPSLGIRQRRRCSTSPQAASASRADQPRPCRPWVTWSRQAAGRPSRRTAHWSGRRC